MPNDKTLRDVFAYHGTSIENAAAIRKDGFREGSYFAYSKKDARVFGGPVVFRVRFSGEPSMWRGIADGWQFHIREPIPASAIVCEYFEGTKVS